jgi:hypothetical protein
MIQQEKEIRPSPLLTSNNNDYYDSISNGERGLGVLLPGGKTQLQTDGSGIDINHEGVLITPTAGFVLKTKLQKSKSNKKVFINICYHEQIEPPGQKKKLDDEGNEVEGFNVPLSMSPIRVCEDKTNVACLVVDAIVHPSVKQDMENDRTGGHRDLLCSIMIQCFDQKYAEYAPLDQQFKLPRLSYCGYINTETGKVIRKNIEGKAEVYKQNVRKRQASPQIEEVNASGMNNSKLSNHEDSTNHNTTCFDSSKDNKEDEHSEGRQLEEMAASALDCQIYMTTSEGVEMTLEAFIETVNKIITDGSDEEDEALSTPVYPEIGLPLLLDSKVTDSFEVTTLRVCFNVPMSFNETTAEVNTTAYSFDITGSSLKHTHVVLPLCIDPSSVVGTLNENDPRLFSLVAEIDRSRMGEDPDVGSKPWILTRGLSKSKNLSSGTATASVHNNVVKEEKKCNGVAFDDPYHARPMYLNPSDVMMKKKNLSGSKLHADCLTNDPLPEDCFHAKDTLSQHWIHQQQKEQEDKLTKKEKERVESKSNDNVEYLNTNDFKPGGKYHQGERDTERKKYDNAQLRTLQEAEEVACKKFKPILHSTAWSQLF